MTQCLSGADPTTKTLAHNCSIVGLSNDTGLSPDHQACATTVLLCKAERQYMLTLQVSRYCLLALQIISEITADVLMFPA